MLRCSSSRPVALKCASTFQLLWNTANISVFISAQWCRLHFGLALTPMALTKSVQAFLEPVQSQGLWVLPYQDDELLCRPSQQQLANRTRLPFSPVEAGVLKVQSLEALTWPLCKLFSWIVYDVTDRGCMVAGRKPFTSTIIIINPDGHLTDKLLLFDFLPEIVWLKSTGMLVCFGKPFQQLQKNRFI